MVLIVQYQKFIYYNIMPIDLNGNKLNNTSIGPKGEVIRTITTDGLVLYLDGGNKNSYVGNGTTVNDLSGNSNTGTLLNGATFSNTNGGTFLFDELDDYMSVSNSSTINPNNGSFTIICWVNSDPSIGGDGWDLWIGKRVNGSNGYYVGVNRDLGARFMLGDDQGGRTDTGFIGYTFNTWAMFTSILDRANNTQTIIRNNYEQTATTTPSGGNYYNTGVLSIGADVGVSAFYINGRMGSVLMYNSALSQPQVSQIFNTQRSRFGI